MKQPYYGNIKVRIYMNKLEEFLIRDGWLLGAGKLGSK